MPNCASARLVTDHPGPGDIMAPALKTLDARHVGARPGTRCTSLRGQVDYFH